MVKQSRLALRIYLAKDSYKVDELSLIAKKKLGEGEQAVALKLYVPDAQKPHLPPWATYLLKEMPAIEDHLKENYTNSALLIATFGGHDYLLTFGHGNFVDEDRVVKRFGLKIALGLTSDTNFKVVRSETVGPITLYDEKQANRDTRFQDFGLEQGHDILKGVMITLDKTLAAHGTWMFGQDAVQINPKFNIHDLGELLSWLHGEYAAAKYTTNEFSWIDSICEVEDKQLITRLDQNLATAVQNAYRTLRGGMQIHSLKEKREETVRKFDIELAPPGPLPYDDALTYSYNSTSSSEFPSLQAYFESLSSMPTLDRMRHDKIVVDNDAGKAVSRSSVYDWLSCEINNDGKCYVLRSGTYFVVDPTLKSEIDNFISKISPTSYSLPRWDAATFTTEFDYNQNVADHHDSECVCLDTEPFYDAPPSKGKFEACDLVRVVNQRVVLIHVKRYRGGSSPLSHLFAQGLVSAKTFDRSAFARQRMGQRVPNVAGWFAADGMKHSGVEVAFAVARKNGGKLTDLPFFTKVNLKYQTIAIRGMGYMVSAQVFECTEAPKKTSPTQNPSNQSGASKKRKGGKKAA